jgi:hypothetical protein
MQRTDRAPVAAKATGPVPRDDERTSWASSDAFDERCRATKHAHDLVPARPWRRAAAATVESCTSATNDTRRRLVRPSVIWGCDSVVAVPQRRPA